VVDRPTAEPVGPRRARPAADVRASRTARRLTRERFATLAFFLVFFAVVGLIKGSTYLSVSNVTTTFAQEGYVMFVAAGVTVTLIAGQFDLSVGALTGLCAVVTASVTAKAGIPPLPGAILVLLVGSLAGLLNALLVTVFQVNAFITTLGTGYVFGGLAILVSGNQAIFEGVPQGLIAAGTNSVFGLALPAVYVLGLLVIAWVVMHQSVLGRYWYAVGANPDAARLAGVPVRKVTILAFVATGLLAGCAGVISVAKFGSADPVSGPELLLPAFAAAFLGSSILSDGRFSVLGTIVAAFLIAFATNGLEVLGLNVWIKPVFSGCVLIVAVALTHALRKGRGARGATS
jgi:ribose transport system permease protein